MPGTTSPTTSRDRALIAGAKTAWPGFSDDKQQLCFALALWNGRDPILKERLFGLTNSEGNHGEDVKEYYFYLDSTPTHSYMKYLYKYPQGEYPYRDLVETNRRRSREEMEYELLDTGIFDDDRYFDVFVEYAKADPEDMLIRISVHNRGPEAAQIHLLPTLVVPQHVVMGRGRAEARAGVRSMRTEHTCFSSAARRLHAAVRRRGGAAVHRKRIECQPSLGTAQSVTLRQRCLSRIRDRRQAGSCQSGEDGNQGCRALRAGCSGWRKSELCACGLSAKPAADAFDDVRSDLRQPTRGCETSSIERITPKSLSEDERRVHRQALAGMLWSKQYYYFDLDRWLTEHDAHPLMGSGKGDCPQRRVVPHAEQRRHLHARQVGVSLVCGMGPGISHHCALAGGLRLRQRAAPADAEEPVCPSQRADPGIRVELQRRESARTRLGDLVSLPD